MRVPYTEGTLRFRVGAYITFVLNRLMDTHRATVPRRQGISLSVLTVGGMAYAVLCLPAIGRRGFPPIDHVWMGMTYLWIGPLTLSTLLDGGSVWSRRTALIAYALFTGFIGAATVGFMVPRHVDFFGTLLMTLTFVGPCHVVITFLIEWLMQWLLGFWRSFGPAESATHWLPRLSLVEFLIGYSIIAATIGFPFSYRHWIMASDLAWGRERADKDWANHSAYSFAERDQSMDAEVGGAASLLRIRSRYRFRKRPLPHFERNANRLPRTHCRALARARHADLVDETTFDLS